MAFGQKQKFDIKGTRICRRKSGQFTVSLEWYAFGSTVAPKRQFNFTSRICYMALNLNKTVVEVIEAEALHSNLPPRKWLSTSSRPTRSNVKRSAKAVRHLRRDADPVQQISAEIAANRPKIQHQFPNAKTTETRPIKYYYSTESADSEVRRVEVVIPAQGSIEAKTGDC